MPEIKRLFNKNPSNLPFISERLSSLENLQQINLKELTQQSRGIYFLMQNITVVYVGQSTDVFSRVKTHIVEAVKEFNNVYFYPVPFGDLLAIERKFIQEFQPRYNSEKSKKITEPVEAKAVKDFPKTNMAELRKALEGMGTKTQTLRIAN